MVMLTAAVAGNMQCLQMSNNCVQRRNRKSIRLMRARAELCAGFCICCVHYNDQPHWGKGIKHILNLHKSQPEELCMQQDKTMASLAAHRER